MKNIFLFFILSSFFFASLCLQSDFQIYYDNYDEDDIISSLRKTYIEIESSFGSNMDKFKPVLDTESQAIVIPSAEYNTPGNVQKFNKSTSSTFVEQKKIGMQFNGEKFYSGIFGNDNFKLGNSEVIKKKISFIIATAYSSLTFNYYNYAFIGLKPFIIGDETKYNIIEQMKNDDLIPNATWFLNFESDTKGKFVIGTLPDIIYSNIYSSEDMIQTHLQKNIYSLKFGEIYYGKIDNYEKRKSVEEFHTLAKININTRLFQCTPDYGTIIYNSFFGKKIEDGICNQGYLQDKYIYYYCHKNKFKMSEMDNLNFVIKKQEGNMTFVFEPKDLFYEHKEYLYFLIIYKPEDYDSSPDSEWVLGTLFLKKYIITFNRNDNLAYFYTKTINKNEQNSGNSSVKYIIIISVLSVIFISCIGFLIYYIKKNKPRKKKANELIDDEFDYTTKQNEEGGDSALFNEKNN